MRKELKQNTSILIVFKSWTGSAWKVSLAMNTLWFSLKRTDVSQLHQTSNCTYFRALGKFRKKSSFYSKTHKNLRDEIHK